MSEQKLSTYGILEQRETKDELDIHVQQIEILGYTVVDGGYTADEIEHFRELIDKFLNEQTEATGGREALSKIQESDVLRACLLYDDSFLKIATNVSIRELVRRTVGAHILMQQNAIVNKPDKAQHHQTSYHRDLPYQHWVASRPIAINALFCVDEFLPETGSTNILPGSHHVEYFPTDEYVQQMEEAVTVPAGSYIVFNSMMYHRAGKNTSNNIRRAVNNIYTTPILKQQIVLPQLLDGKWSDDPDLSFLLGYDSNPVGSIMEWRKQRLQRQNNLPK